MASKVLFFTGAPESSALDWSPGGLLSEFQDPISAFASVDTNHQQSPCTSSTVSRHAAWRSLPLAKESLSTGFSQQYAISFNRGPDQCAFGPSPQFLTSVDLSLTDGDNDDPTPALSQFYEHSIAVHEELASSQLVSQSTGEATTSFLSDGSSSFASGHGSQPGSIKGPLLFRGSELLSDLKSLPSAAYLTKIQPQTMTCNLIVGIISISQPRAVKTRWGATRYLVEILVGDETKAGFVITYWLPYDTVDESPLAGLRPRDNVLVQNVALNVFMNKVYGSSLRKNLTRVHLFYRMKLDSRDVGGYYSTSDLSHTGPTHPQLEKTRRVRDWVLNFVGRGNHHKGQMDHGPRWNKPPADDSQLT
ncbi:hypothetical protein N658DRAFT_505602 [Parathielavia hyrcaniae]|uniref:Uncharacterized protein n=1 Tax=Parathielavia hyrcaniae TaxID=113614 RepID=A0AAN6Q438_9PEZI|nr:hypothetical protein N658DRAFT_505602 [Parathielavia hyrcaniae]